MRVKHFLRYVCACKLPTCKEKCSVVYTYFIMNYYLILFRTRTFQTVLDKVCSSNLSAVTEVISNKK
jgi:hypothetical protein